MESGSGNISELLLAWSGGDAQALELLTPLVYEHLHRLARHYMASERASHTLQASALVNEAWIRLVDSNQVQWKNRTHFFVLAAQIMRRILVDFARAHRAERAGGGFHRTTLDEGVVVSNQSDPDLVAIDDALTALSVMDSRKAKVVELRFFGGLDEKEIAGALRISVDTVQRDWKAARAWLYAELKR